MGNGSNWAKLINIELNRRMRKGQTNGFTSIELIIVILVMSILAGTLIIKNPFSISDYSSIAADQLVADIQYVTDEGNGVRVTTESHLFKWLTDILSMQCFYLRLCNVQHNRCIQNTARKYNCSKHKLRDFPHIQFSRRA
jgi:hypothetical protein